MLWRIVGYQNRQNEFRAIWESAETLERAADMFIRAAEEARENEVVRQSDGTQFMLTIIGGKGVKEPGLKEQIDKAKTDLDAMTPIKATITENIGALPYGQRVNAILRQLDAFPSTIKSDALGDVVMPGKQAMQKVVKHMEDDVALSAFPIMPEVVEQVKLITKVINHRGRRIDTYTLASPVKLNGTDGYMGVIIRDVEGGLKPYVQQVVFPDGTVFTFEEENKKGGGTLEPQPKRTDGSSPTTPLIKKIPQSSDNVKNSLKGLDADYMAAVEAGDMKKAQKMVNEAAESFLVST